MQRFELRVLGSPEIVDQDGEPVGLPLGKPLAVLCFLALEPSDAGRGDLARILWPTSNDSRARASIRQALWLIRKHTDADVLNEDAGRLRVNRTILSIDLDAFEADLAAARLDAAVERWRGGPLRGFAVPDAKPWLAWADELRARWETVLGQALEERARSLPSDERLPWWDRALQVRPYRTEVHLERVRTLVDLRDADGAAQALTRLQAVAEPEEHELVDDAAARVRLLQRASFGDPGDRLVPEFVGRSAEFSALMEAWRSALSGRPRLVSLTGPAGIGKTALAQEMVRHTEVDGAQSIEVRAVRTETSLEFGVVGTLISELLRRPGAAGTSPGSSQILRALVPSDGESGSTTPLRPTALADALADLLDAVSHEAPAVVLLDDVHWMDEASALVLLRALRLLEGARVLVICTSRFNETESRAHTVFRDAADAGNARILELAPLGVADVQEMVLLLLAEADPDALQELGRRIHEASAGVPLHAVELLQGLRDRGYLVRDPDGHWVLANDGGGELLPLPDSLQDALRERVQPLGARAFLLGQTLARSPEADTPAALATAAELDEREAAAALAELLDRDLVRWTRNDRLQLAHETLVAAFLPPASPMDEPAAAPAPRWRRWAAAAGLAALLPLAFCRSPDPPAPFGGGTIWLTGVGVAESFRIGPSREWVPIDSVQIPAGLTLAPLADHDGRTTWGGSTRNVERIAPDAILWRDGVVDTFFASPGEDIVQVVRPEGDAALLRVQYPDTLDFRFMAVRIALDAPHDTVVLASGSGSYSPMAWFADGSEILVTVNQSVDSLFIVDPSGLRIQTIRSPDEDIGAAFACGDDRILLASYPPGDQLRWWLWTMGDAVPVPWSPSRESSSAAACSPDGSAILYLSRLADQEVLLLETLDGEVLSRRDVTGQGILYVRWNAPAGRAPVTVRLGQDELTLDRGSRDTLDFRILNGAGEALERPVVWGSRDPALASVDELGVVTANRPGTTVVKGSVDGWLSDSVVVTVRESPDAPGLAFSDSFATLDLSRWTVEGNGDPQPIRLPDGSPALRADGDGFYSDGIHTVGEFDLTGGATLEVRFRLDRITRRDRQRIHVCLREGEGRGAEASASQQQICLRWPSGEGADFSTREINFQRTGFPIGAVPIGDLIRPGEWTTLAIQFPPDGTASAIVNDSLVAVHPVPLRNRPNTRFHVSIEYATVDTELLVRDVTLWAEERHR